MASIVLRSCRTVRRRRLLLAATSSSSLCAWVIYQARHRQPLIIHSPDSVVAPLLSQTIAAQGFAPAWWLPGGFLQTVRCYFRLNRSPLPYEFTRIALRGQDGGVFSIDLAHAAEDLPQDAPILMFLPTLTGCSRQAFGFVALCRSRGIRCVSVNRRGHAQQLTTAQFSIAGSVQDLRQAVEYCSSTYPQARVCLVGSSMGSALLTRYLGDEAEELPPNVVGAVALCFGCEAGVALARIKQPFATTLVKRLKRYFLHENQEVLEEADAASFRRCETAEDCHAFCVAHSPYSGYNLSGQDAGPGYHDFCRRSNPMDVIWKVKVPTLIINAVDDPIAVVQNIFDHWEVFLSHPYLALVLSPVGGHLGFLHQGPDGRLVSWAETVSVQFIETLAFGGCVAN